jgi:type III secretion protein J
LRRTALPLLVATAALAIAGCRTAVLHGLSEQDANQVIAVLQDQGVVATKELDNAEAGTWKLSVSRADAGRVFSVLQGYRLPSTRGRRVQDVFGKSKLLTGPLEEKALYLEALQGEIAHTLESVSGVVSARVHVAMPELDLSGQTAHEVKASVMLEFHPDGSGRAPLREEEVRAMVASGVNDLRAQNVSVVMKPIALVRSQQSYDFVAFGPIVVAAPSVTAFKILTGGVVAIVLALGASLYWSGRVIGELREQLLAGPRASAAIQKPPKPVA